MIRVSNKVRICAVPSDGKHLEMTVESTDMGSSVYLKFGELTFEVAALDMINAICNAMNCR